MALPQPLHIFKKDLTHLWPETLVALLLFVAFAWAAPSGWANSQYVVIAVLLAGFLKIFLMPISWLVIISRLIHDESLVGDRQFWTSRPYHWASLFAAKLLYIFAFLYVPFFIMQVYLLKHAGLYPSTVLPALLHNLLLLTVIIVVPLTAIAAVTGTFARMLLSTIGAVIYVVIVALGVLYLVFRRMPPPGLEYIFYGLVILLPLAALVYQFATRKTTISRIALIATPLLVVLLLLLTPTTALIRHAYPADTGSGPKLSGLPAERLPHTVPAGHLRTFQGDVQVGLPVAVAGLDEKTNYTVHGTAITIDGPGVHWSSPFLNQLNTEINAYRPGVLIPVSIPLGVFNKIHDQPVDVHLSLAADHLKLDTPTTWKATLLPFSVPGHGLCSYSSENPDDPPTCRYPFAAPDPNFVTADVAYGSCDAATQRVPRQMYLSAGAGTLDFDPVVTAPLNFQSSMQQEPAHRISVCPGTPLNFIQAKSLGNTRLEVELKQITLDPLAVRVADRSVVVPQVQPAPEPDVH